jgi:hypothetical protein
MTNHVLRKLSGWAGALAAASLLAACGGGGGSPGSNGQTGQPASKASSVVLSASATTIASSGQDGTEVVLTAIVKDSNNNTLPGETVSFKSSSGNISNTNRVTDNSGTVKEKLSVKGDSSLRDIEITASAGGATSTKIVVKVVPATQTLTLTTDSGTLQSAGVAGTEVQVVAVVRDSNNSVMPNVRVDLAADSGSLTMGTRLTDANGRVTEKLSPGGDPTSRVIKITASAAGLTPATTQVQVAGTRVTVNANGSVNLGATTDVTVKVADSAGNALTNRAVTFGASLNTLTVKGGAPAVTDAAGQLVLSYNAAKSGKDLISIKSMGETSSTEIAVGDSSFSVSVVDGSGNPVTSANINTCQRILVHGSSGLSGSVAISSSRGTVYSNSTCTSILTSAVAVDVNSNATAYVQATSAGIATLNATVNSAGGATAQGLIEFVAQLLPSAIVTLQADPAVLGTNSAGSTGQQSTIRAVVRDGTAQNNLVKNAVVSFSIVTDPSGGYLSQPSVVTTGSDGTATVSYVAGSSSTSIDGVTLRASVLGAAGVGTVNLTVAKKSLFISAGTGNTIESPDTTTYRKDYAVFVSDASGNAVPGVNITASVRPRTYRKGELAFNGTNWSYKVAIPIECANEDIDGDGSLSAGEDSNTNGRLDPGIPITVTSTGTTDVGGKATVSLIYPKDRAYWLTADLTIRGKVSGTEASYVGFISPLVGSADDYKDKDKSPPGQTSPYGVNACSTAN